MRDAVGAQERKDVILRTPEASEGPYEDLEHHCSGRDSAPRMHHMQSIDCIDG